MLSFTLRMQAYLYSLIKFQIDPGVKQPQICSLSAEIITSQLLTISKILLKLVNLRTPPHTLLFKCLKSNSVDMASQTQLFPITDHSLVAKTSTSFHFPGNLTMSHPHHTTQMVKLNLQLKQSNSCSRKQNEMAKIPGWLY